MPNPVCYISIFFTISAQSGERGRRGHIQAYKILSKFSQKFRHTQKQKSKKDSSTPRKTSAPPLFQQWSKRKKRGIASIKMVVSLRQNPSEKTKNYLFLNSG